MKAVIFDLDGTLLDVSESIFWQYEVLTREFNGFQASREAITAALKSGKQEGTRQLVTNMRAPFDRVEQRRDQLRAESLQHLRLYPHVTELLTILNRLGTRVAVLAGDSHDTSQHVERLGLAPHLTVLVTPDQVQHPAPHPVGVNVAMRHLDVLPHEVMVISNLPEGITAARKAAVHGTVGITHGFGQPEELRAAGADHIVHDIPSLLDVLG